eukprot:5029203-Prymnesium_polylepis.2
MKAPRVESAERKAVARLSVVGLPVRCASRLTKISNAYSNGTPIGQTSTRTTAMLRLSLYSSTSQSRFKSSCKNRRVMLGVAVLFASNGSQKNVLNILVDVLGTSRKEMARANGRMRCNPASIAARALGAMTPAFRRPRMTFQMTCTAIASTRKTIGHNEPIKIRLR